MQFAVVPKRWHTDRAGEENPPFGFVLYSEECPPYGGDTLFASLSAAYDALSQLHRLGILSRPLSARERPLEVFGQGQRFFPLGATSARVGETGVISP